MANEINELTLKAQHTRQYILETALSLFVRNGYEATTMREIANAAGCSLGLTYRYFASKEELVLALYWQMAADTGTQIDQLSAGTIAERFFWLMSGRLEQAIQYRELFRVVFGATMNPNSGVNILSNKTAEMHADLDYHFKSLVTKAADAPSTAQAEDLATLLHFLHFGVILFWLYDRTSNQRATRDLLILIRDLMKAGRRFLALPFVRQGMVRASNIVVSLFVG